MHNTSEELDRPCDHSSATPSTRKGPHQPPVPGPDDVLLRIHAAAPATPNKPDDNAPPTHAVAGTITALGASVRGLDPGDEVFALTTCRTASPRKTNACTCAHDPDLLLPADDLAFKPSTLTFAQAASTLRPSLIAWQVLNLLLDHDTASLTGRRILIHGAGSGPGAVLVQLARRENMLVTATVGKREERARVQAWGACDVRDAGRVWERGALSCEYDYAVDCVGGEDDVRGCLKAVKCGTGGGKVVGVARAVSEGEAGLRPDLDVLGAGALRPNGEELTEVAMLFEQDFLVAVSDEGAGEERRDSQQEESGVSGRKAVP